MAAPTRLDPSSPASIAGASFSTARKGFAQDEVRAALQSISVEVARLGERVRQLEAELAHARRETAAPVELDEAALTVKIGEETVRVLQTARESASQIRSRAEENAARLVAEAADDVSRMRHDADLEVARKRADAASDAEAELALAKQQGREMVNEARAYRERVLADLEARTSRARQQLEELAHGRERLLQVFERARLVAIDVSTELGKHPGPSELVNLANVTGPVPVTVPSAREARPDAGVDDRSVAELAAVPEPDAGTPAGDDTAVPGAVPAVELFDGAATADDPDAAADPAPEAAGDGAPQGDDTAGEHPEDELPGDPADSGDSVESGGAADTADTTDTGDADGLEDSVDTGDSVDEVRDGAAASLTPLELVADLEPETGPAATEVAEPDSRPLLAPVATATDAGTDAEAGPVTVEPATDPHARPEPESESESVGQPDNVVALFARLRQETGDAVPDQTAAIAMVHSTTVKADPEPVEADDEVVENPFTRRDEALVPLIVAAARKLKRVLADEQNGVLDVLRGRQSVTALGGVLPGADDHAAAYISAIGDELAAAAAAGAREAGGKLAKSSTALEAAHSRMRNELVGTLRDRLDRSVAAGGGDNTDVTRGVRNVYREWKTQHIDEQLDDVFRAAFAGGASAAVAAGTEVLWLVEPGHTGCADCADNTLAGVVPAGSEFPTGHTAAPAHPGCRCLVLPA